MRHSTGRVRPLRNVARSWATVSGMLRVAEALREAETVIVEPFGVADVPCATVRPSGPV
jgi:hypothetical protein